MMYAIPRQHPLCMPRACNYPYGKEIFVAFQPLDTNASKNQPATKESPTRSERNCQKNDRTNTGCGCRKDESKSKRFVQKQFVHTQKTPIHYHDETPDAAKMSLDVMGYTLEDLSIEVEDYVVSISGTRTNKLGDVFSIQRRFRLDKNTADQDGVTASLEDGVLEINVPKKKSLTGPRKIAIRSVPKPETKVATDLENNEAIASAVSIDTSKHNQENKDTDTVVSARSDEKDTKEEEQEEIELTVVTPPQEENEVEEPENNTSELIMDGTNTDNAPNEDPWEEVHN